MADDAKDVKAQLNELKSQETSLIYPSCAPTIISYLYINTLISVLKSMLHKTLDAASYLRVGELGRDGDHAKPPKLK